MVNSKNVLYMLTYALANILGTVSPEIFDLVDSVPWLRSPANEVVFQRGWDFFQLARSSCIRINARGIQSKPAHWTVRAIDTLWYRQECMPGVRGGLCELTDGGVIFLDSGQGVLPTYNGSVVVADFGCTRTHDGRNLDPTGWYDVSSCDVLDNGGDLVFCGRNLYFARTSLEEWSYWALCLIAIFLVRSLSYLVVHRIQSNASREFLWNDVLTVILCLIVLLSSALPHGDLLFVTEEDRLFWWVLLIYVVIYIVLFVWYCISNKENDPPLYNLIAASLQVIATRLYLSSDTPYNPVLIWIISTRMLVKLRTLDLSILISISALMDSILLSLLGVWGFNFNYLFLIPLLMLSLSVSDYIILI